MAECIEIKKKSGRPFFDNIIFTDGRTFATAIIIHSSFGAVTTNQI
jgi:hypothetical protein